MKCTQNESLILAYETYVFIYLPLITTQDLSLWKHKNSVENIFTHIAWATLNLLHRSLSELGWLVFGVKSLSENPFLKNHLTLHQFIFCTGQIDLIVTLNLPDSVFREFRKLLLCPWMGFEQSWRCQEYCCLRFGRWKVFEYKKAKGKCGSLIDRKECEIVWTCILSLK